MAPCRRSARRTPARRSTCQELTVRAALDEDRDLVYHAVLTDPQVQAALSLDDAWRMTDELIAAEAEWLPGWLGGDAPDWMA